MADPSIQDGLAALGLPGPVASSPQAPTGDLTPQAPNAPDAGGAAGSMVFSQGTPPSPPNINTKGADFLPRVDYAVKQVESGNSQLGKDGKILTSPAGALGISQLMPDTAKSLGVDPMDEHQNAEGGRRYLSNLFQEYGNWTDAIAAYSAGPKTVDRWIAAGRPDSGKNSLPDETRRYVPDVLSKIGMSPGLAFVASREAPTIQEGLDALKEHSVSQDKGTQIGPEDPAESSTAVALLGANQDPVDISPEGQAETLAVMGGAFTGLRDIIAGPTQAGLEMVSPSAAQGFTKFVNDHLTPFGQQGEEHPFAHFAGQIVGTGVGLAVATRLVGPLVGPLMTPAVQALMRGIPTALKATGAGAALGATSFNKDPAGASRLGEAVLGGSLGYFGTMIGRLISQGLEHANNSVQVQQWLAQLKQNVAGLEPSLSGLKMAFAERYAAATRARDRLYTVRDLAGRPLAGYPTGLEEGGGVAKVINDAMEGNVGRDQATAQTRTVAREMDRALGLDDQRAAQAMAEKARKDYEKSFGDWGDTKVGSRPLRDYPVEFQDNLIRQGVLPNRPPPPAPFESAPITPAQMAEARRVVNRSIGRARETAIRTQLNILKRGLDQTASETAKAAGVDVAEYERLQARADKFNKEVIAPMRAIAGKNRTVREFNEQVTPAEMYNQTLTVLKSNDRQAQETFAKLLGPRGRQQAKLAILHDMMDHAITDLGGRANPARIARYIHDNRTGLQTVLGRDEFDQLSGTAKVAQDLLAEGKQEGWTRFLGHHSWLKGFGVLKMFEGAMTGSPARVMEGAGMIGTAVGMEMLRTGISRIASTPRLIGVISRIAKTQPGTPEMVRLIKSIDAAMASQTKTLSRVGGGANQGQPAGDIIRGGAEAAGGMMYSLVH